MVAASKMRKAQERMRHARPYGEKIRNVAAHISHANPEYRHPFLVARDTVKRVGLIVITTDKGLCGALNTNLLRAGAAAVQGLAGRGRGDRRLLHRQQGLRLHAAPGREHRLPRSADRRPPADGKADRHHQGHAGRLYQGPLRPPADRLHALHQHDEAGAGDRAAAAALGRAHGRAGDGVGLHLRARGEGGARPGVDALYRGASSSRPWPRTWPRSSRRAWWR